MVGLYEEPEKPHNAVEYKIIYQRFLKKYLGGPNDIDVDKLKSEYEKIKEENYRL